MCNLMADPKKGHGTGGFVILDADGKEVIWAG